MKEQPRQAIESALYELGVLTDILGVIASADISGTKPVCGTYIEYLAARQREQQDRIEHALSCMGRA
jgi:hypothetical protein